MKKLSKIKSAYKLFKEARVLEKAELIIHLDGTIMGEGDHTSVVESPDEDEIPFVVDVDTTGGKRRPSLSADDTIKLINWSMDSSKKETYGVCVSELDEIAEVIKHESITRIKVEYDHEMAKDMEEMLKEQVK